jgi:U3 small nucleolar RNA-associated protein 21
VAYDERLSSALSVWRQCQEHEGARIGELIGFCNGIVPFLRNPHR